MKYMASAIMRSLRLTVPFRYLWIVSILVISDCQSCRRISTMVTISERANITPLSGEKCTEKTKLRTKDRQRLAELRPLLIWPVYERICMFQTLVGEWFAHRNSERFPDLSVNAHLKGMYKNKITQEQKGDPRRLFPSNLYLQILMFDKEGADGWFANTKFCISGQFSHQNSNNFKSNSV